MKNFLKIQLVGKISGEDRSEALLKFCRVVAPIQLKYGTMYVTNPMALCKPEWSWARCMAVCLYHIVFKANTIAIFPDWCGSKGARIEVFVAILLKKNIINL